jgi:hypothetical protein
MPGMEGESRTNQHCIYVFAVSHVHITVSPVLREEGGGGLQARQGLQEGCQIGVRARQDGRLHLHVQCG